MRLVVILFRCNILCKICGLTGHSKTIVGVEEHHDDSLRLLILDPSVAPYKMKSAAQAEDSGNLIRLIRHPLSSLRRKQYQLLAVDGILNDYEIEVRVTYR